jgi:hypothetical protein
VLFLALFIIYNSNGREIGGYDSQPAKFAAVELATHGTLTVDPIVRRVPQYAERPAFARDRQGHYRSAYSPVPILFGGVFAWIVSAFGFPLNADLAPNVIATITAAALTAAAVTLVFATLSSFSRATTAFWVSIGLGLGTNYWATVSRTLGQHESVAFGAALALFAWTRPPAELTARWRWLGGVGLAISSTARLQTFPMAAIVALGLARRLGWRAAAGPLALIAAAVAALMAAQQYWFGSFFGAVPALETLHPAVHAVSGSISQTPWLGAAGLLIAPNRGLLIYSPVVAIALAGALAARQPKDLGIPWLLAAAGVQFGVYACYSVWWGGHTFGPRYMLDVLVLLTPSAALAVDRVFVTRAWKGVCAAALAWSVLVAATGAFCADAWNTAPVDVDRNHARLWDWRDPQILRAWDSGWSPRNFDLFRWAAGRGGR